MAPLINRMIDGVRRRAQHETTGHRGRKHDPLYRIRKLLFKAGDDPHPRLAQARLRLEAGDPDGSVAAAGQLITEVTRDLYRAPDLQAARQVPELRLLLHSGGCNWQDQPAARLRGRGPRLVAYAGLRRRLHGGRG